MRTRTKYIHIRIDNSLKNEFYNHCSSKLITPSKLIRKLIDDYLNMEKGKNNEK